MAFWNTVDVEEAWLQQALALIEGSKQVHSYVKFVGD